MSTKTCHTVHADNVVGIYDHDQSGVCISARESSTSANIWLGHEAIDALVDYWVAKRAQEAEAAPVVAKLATVPESLEATERLRAETGRTWYACRAALLRSGGDVEAARRALREKT